MDALRAGRALWPAVLLLAGCSTGPALPAPLQALRAQSVVVAALPAGTLLRLLPVQGALPPDAKARAVDGLFREALRQSPHLDVAAGPVAADAAATATASLQLTVDQESRALATTLSRDGQVLHVASASYADRALVAALDELAVRTRLALGDPLAVQPLPVAAAYTADLEAAALCEEGLARVQEGAFASALRLFDEARRRDGASPTVLDAIASVDAVLGQTEPAQQLAEEALRMQARLAPTTQHRLARTLLLSRASRMPEATARLDRDLLVLARVAEQERPFDPEPRLTEGVAHNFLGKFDAAAAVLRPLAGRLPGNASVAYHLGWAELALGNAKAALGAFTRVAPVLPAGTTVVPRALALYQGGAHEELRAFLAALADDPAVRGGPALHEVHRMQAAHALLCGRTQEAGDLVLADLAWMLEQPGRLRDRAGELADAGEVLVRLGRGESLRPVLASMQRLALPPLVADAAAYVQGLVDAAACRGRVPAAEAGLLQRGATVWSYSLTAFGHHLLGELGDENAALAQAAQESSSPLVKAALVRNLRALGRVQQADALRDAMRREFAQIDLRRRFPHPLFGPELALASMVE